MTSPPLDATTLGYIGWNRITEPEDVWAHAVIHAWDVAESWAWLKHSASRGDAPENQASHLVAMMPGQVSKRLQGSLMQAVERWSKRIVNYDPESDVEAAAAVNATILTPESPQWPAHFEPIDEFTPPLCLWVRGDLDVVNRPAVSVVGARAATAYGEYVTSNLVDGLSDQGLVIVSGGAYGIDAVAHRAALAGDTPTVAVLAGGVDRLYPAGNTRLFEHILEGNGAVISEMPPGSAPRRMRFLQRNRIIAALGQATIVCEAAWRSGALSTAQRAAAICRPVGAVPGPITSAASAGCHRLMRDGLAVCVTTASEVLELLPQGSPAQHDEEDASGGWRPTDLVDAAVWDAMPIRATTTISALSQIAGRTDAEVLGALTRLELHGKVTNTGGRWKRSRLPVPAN